MTAKKETVQNVAKTEEVQQAAVATSYNEQYEEVPAKAVLDDILFEETEILSAGKFDLELNKPYYLMFSGAVVMVTIPAKINSKTGEVERKESVEPAIFVIEYMPVEVDGKKVLRKTGNYGQLVMPTVLRGNLKQIFDFESSPTALDGLLVKLVKQKGEGRGYFDFNITKLNRL